MIAIMTLSVQYGLAEIERDVYVVECIVKQSVVVVNVATSLSILGGTCKLSCVCV